MVNSKRSKRALVLIGAGASIEYGAPSTAVMTERLHARIRDDSWMQHIGGDQAFSEILATLSDYRVGGEPSVNFEHIYHCAHELLFSFPPSNGAVNAYRPLLFPLLERRFHADERALRALVGKMGELLFDEIVKACAQPRLSVAPLTRFLDALRAEHVTRIYTTNYDDFALQAAPDLFTGYPAASTERPVRFDGRTFWARKDSDSLLHLHGSVHMGFARDIREAGLMELFWYADRGAAQHDSTSGGSGERRLGGSDVEIAPIITGLDKLSRLQRRPLSYFYAALGEDALRADLILVLGCGLGDLHLNNWLYEARSHSPRPPLILVDWWPEGFAETAAFNAGDDKLIEMWHKLLMPLGYTPHNDLHSVAGWTVDAGKTCAVWDGGFQAFLNAPDALNTICAMLRDR